MQGETLPGKIMYGKTLYGNTLGVTASPVPGLVVWDLPVHGDARGWFKENWQREKMIAEGLDDFGPVQNNVSFNGAAGVTRGIHAEPWDKLVSVACGRVFGAWVDLRAGPTFGTVFTCEIDPSRAVFVPRGVGNAYQTLEANTAYSYLVNEHWSPTAPYTYVNLADESLAIEWPVPLDQAVISAKDQAHPPLASATPIAPQKALVVGAGGQLGQALRRVYADSERVEFAGRAEIDLADAALVGREVDLSGATGTTDTTGVEQLRPWRDYDTIINAAAFTAVDAAETADGRTAAWAVNVTGVAALAKVATAHRITLVHVSSDYVFDGRAGRPYREGDAVCPLGVYGQTKAAGEALGRSAPRHYLIRTSWVVGDGRNFVRTMASLAERGIDPAVVDDQVGRLTFTDDLARGIRFLIETGAPYGTYHVTGSGEPASWADVARRVFELTGHDPQRVRGVSTADYYAEAAGPIAPRPASSVLDLGKVAALGFELTDWQDGLARYLGV